MKSSVIGLALLGCVCFSPRTGYCHGGDQGELWNAFMGMEQAAQVAPPLTDAAVAGGLQSNNPQLQGNALIQLSRSNLSPVQRLNLLQPIIKRKPASAAEAAVQRDAIVLLGLLASDATPAVPDLIKLVKNGAPDAGTANTGDGELSGTGNGTKARGGIREMAIRAAGWIAPRQPAVQELLAQTVNDADESIALAAIEVIDSHAYAALKTGVPLPDTAVQFWQPALGKAVPRTWKSAFSAPVLAYDAMGRISRDATTLSPAKALQRLTQIDQQSIEQAATAFIVFQTKPAPAEAMPPLLQLATGGASEPTQAAAILTLGHLGFSADERPMRAVLSAVASGKPMLVFAANDALKHLQAADKVAITPLVEALDSRNGALRQQAARSLSLFGAGAKPGLPGIVRALQATKKSPAETSTEYAQRVHDFLRVPIGVGAEARESRSAVIALFSPDSALLQNVDAKDAAAIQSDLLSIVVLTGAPETEDERAIVLQQALAGLTSRNPRLFSSSARAAGVLGKEAKAAVPLLLDSLQLKPPAPGDIIGGVYTVHPATLYDAVRALGKIGSDTAVPRLTRIAAGQDDLSGLLNGEARAALQKIKGG